MPVPDYYKLNNPAWYSLAETHKDLSIGNEAVKRYSETIAPFLGCVPGTKELDNLNDWVKPGAYFFIIGDLPLLPPGYTVVTRLLCVQMVCTGKQSIPATVQIEALGDADEDEMTALINLVQPGYYKPGTRRMGDYFGIRNNGQLVAMTGERMRMAGLSEISAVVTHPGFTGRTYAQQLVAHAVNKNLAAGITPFLHVAETNERAIKIYERLGFVQRRIIAFWKIERDGL